ncbi:HNH endonuclease signature motif containing protein [Corynebacterium lactis]|uniref:HNH endonuclease n=1 Tax=Corynebacterium lactis RW2-5 TaxID=1408189 RepID=A0A0K2H2B8_9CORY|nr:HNH endonuclease signature motif containing protein [Corynebacterium lactis]ALA67846.1 HNH endonuclease [Corynebacterium lactis RW2-5]
MRHKTITYEDTLADSAPRFHHELSEEAPAKLGIQRNRVELELALACAPSSPTEDVEDHVSHVSAALGMSRARAMQYVDIGIQLNRMPKLCQLLTQRAHLPFLHMRTIADAVLPLQNADTVAEIEQRLLEFVSPRRNNEVLRGVRSLHHFLQNVIEEFAPLLRPRDIPGDSVPAITTAATEKIGEHIGFSSGDALTEVYMELAPERAHEFELILDEIAADQDCTKVEALTHLMHGTVEVTATLNLYCPLTEEKPQKAWIGGLGWINRIATASWLDRVSSVRLMADETVEGYTPSERQRTFVQGRDGTCRFPGCEVEATKCDLDHIEPYNHEDPESGGASSTHNLHCLCRKHHNLKTSGLWNVAREIDGTEYWTSTKSGTTLVSQESGPMAGHGRYSYEIRRVRKGQTLREYNQRRHELLHESRVLVEQARAECGF